MAPYLAVVSAVQGHSLVPEMFEECRQNLIFNVLRLNTVSGTTLLDNLQHRHVLCHVTARHVITSQCVGQRPTAMSQLDMSSLHNVWANVQQPCHCSTCHHFTMCGPTSNSHVTARHVITSQCVGQRPTAMSLLDMSSLHNVWANVQQPCHCSTCHHFTMCGPTSNSPRCRLDTTYDSYAR